MRRRWTAGFTVIELVVCISVASLLIPSVFMAWRSMSRAHYRASARLDAASGMRAFSEELRRDLMSMRVVASPTSRTQLTLKGPVIEPAAPCPKVTYRIDEHDVLRREGAAGCGPARAVATSVRSIRQVLSPEPGTKAAGAKAPQGSGRRIRLVVTFARRVGVGQEQVTSFSMGLVGGVQQ